MKASVARLLRRQLDARGFEIRRSILDRRARLLRLHRVDVVIDVGAAGGSYGRQLRAHRYGGRIVSFEPLAPSFADLAAAAEGDPRWDVHQLALGEASSTADLHVASNRDSSSLLPMLGAHLKASPTTQMETTQVVRVERLDDVLGTLDGSRPFLKIDAQGYERQVLAGAPETLKACVGLQLELSLVPLYEGGMLIDEALTWAYDSGFILMSVEQGFTASDGRILQMDGVFFRGE